MVTHFTILALKVPWIEEPGGLQAPGPQRVGHQLSNWAPEVCVCVCVCVYVFSYTYMNQTRKSSPYTRERETGMPINLQHWCQLSSFTFAALAIKKMMPKSQAKFSFAQYFLNQNCAHPKERNVSLPSGGITGNLKPGLVKKSKSRHILGESGT